MDGFVIKVILLMPKRLKRVKTKRVESETVEVSDGVTFNGTFDGTSITCNSLDANGGQIQTTGPMNTGNLTSTGFISGAALTCTSIDSGSGAISTTGDITSGMITVDYNAGNAQLALKRSDGNAFADIKIDSGNDLCLSNRSGNGRLVFATNTGSSGGVFVRPNTADKLTTNFQVEVGNGVTYDTLLHVDETAVDFELPVNINNNDLVVTNGSISGAAITGTSLDTGTGTITTTGAISGGAITGTALSTSGEMDSNSVNVNSNTASISSTGVITGASETLTGEMACNSVNVNSNTASMSSTGVITGASETLTGEMACNSVNVNSNTAAISSTGAITCTSVNAGSGTIQTTGSLNGLISPKAFLRVLKSSSTLLATGVSTTVPSWDTPLDASNITFNSSTGIATIDESGVYLATYHVVFNTNNTGVRRVYIRKNGANEFYAGTTSLPIAGFNHQLSGSAVMTLTATNTLDIVAYQNSGVGLNIGGGSTSICRFSVIKLFE